MHFVHAFIRYFIIIYFIKWNGYNFHILKRQCFKDDENIKERSVRKCKKNNCNKRYHSIVYIKNKRGVRGEEHKKKKIINNKYLFLLNNFFDINKDKTYLSTSLKRKYFKNQKNDAHKIWNNEIKDYKTINLYMNKIEEESKEEKQKEENILNKDNINNKSIYNNNNNDKENDIFDDKFNTKQYEKIIKKKNIHSILLCGGIGKRTELIGPKQFLKLNDIPLFIYSFNLFIKCNLIKSLTLVCDKKHFQSIIQSINVYNKILLKRKMINSFLKNLNDKLNVNMKEYHENEEDNIKEFTSQKINIEDSQFNDASNITDYINKNTYIIYDNEKNKCILDMKELLNDLSQDIRIRKKYEKHEKNEKHIIRIKPKHININRYKLLKIVESGKERLDSFLNAMKSIDIELDSQTYIYELLKKYSQEKNEKNDNILYEFEDININNCNKNDNSNNDNIENNNIKKKNKKKINVTNILIHDGARPFLSEFDLFNLIYYSTVDKNVILGSKATDTIKLIQHEEENKKKTTSHFIKKTIDRDTIFQAQTPQIFDSKTLHNNILTYILPMKNNEKNINIINNNNNNNHSNGEEQNSKQFTDTSSLYEYFNKSKKKKKIFVLQSNFPNFKVTTPEDVLHSFFLMKYIYNYKFIDIEESIFKDEYINSHSSYILKKQFNNFFFYDDLNEKQKILYHKFYYVSK
ncbi:2-C-methyl-D-erythritol 4-phosphate cytidylyltransferase, putative [Plasmodium sp. gorilla clade G2]|uniref:2-C-methyl-D-erythritol 4-phosphate cytidylyltransferase, putative n=1 Tax=Plasmodium sp. gorilla clade G2 TaxID=880535 RepID=UPI000D224D2F|nr:2-C-methyl-D-erythritol 4-phosphate cytidylyltransferase, putative [Plasmodium sp. gorilla clade G2]SOV10223.1 2-C-methyl-D-erythritol 4-phosphate cytidylyltransferase, putative [Plasmodium sp. gorilla clade G2]